MALVVITIADDPEGNANVAIQSEPALDVGRPDVLLTPAQQLALDMLQAAMSQTEVKRDRGLIQLIQ
ncbi:hypothetical protein [Cupriavidus sp. CuC1]|uniref:hypothetical protein n=1 Tax=Cupriavidus sp. CuC1 TaxID=3373131 RepID=UPI0037D5AD93